MDDLELPQSPVESLIADIWQQRVGISPIGRQDRFTELGGTSLVAESVLMDLQLRLGRSLSAELMSDDPTVAQMAERIEQQQRDEFTANTPTCVRMSSATPDPGAADNEAAAHGTSDRETPDHRVMEGSTEDHDTSDHGTAKSDHEPSHQPPHNGGHGNGGHSNGRPNNGSLNNGGHGNGGHRNLPAMMFAGAGASSVSFIGLSRHFADRRDSWSFHAHGFHSRGIPDWTVPAHARRHLRKIRTLVQPTQPIILIGHSFGGHIAQEVARRWEADGGQVAAVIMLDTVMSALDGKTVANYKGEPPQTPPLRQRLATHWRIATAGIIRRDPQTQQHVMWEQAIRVQNRLKVKDVHPRTTIYITDENAAQQPLWESLAQPPRIVRIHGDHVSLLTNPDILRTVVDDLERAEAGGGGLDPREQ